MRFSIVPFLLLAIPLGEIAMFVVVGSQIGVLPTLALVLITAVTGSILLRIQGFGVVRRIQETMNEGGVPGRDLVHGMMIMVAGVLLLTPGFITDTLGFLLFIPAIRDIGWKFLRSRIVVMGGAADENVLAVAEANIANDLVAARGCSGPRTGAHGTPPCRHRTAR